jgi:hypothetical protein
METEACNIIQLNNALHSAFPVTQFLWQPTSVYVGYPYNFEWKGTRDAELIAKMKEQSFEKAEVIQLTIHGGFVYYK